MAKKVKGKLVEATTTATWAVSNEEFRRLARTGEFAPEPLEEATQTKKGD